MSPPVFAVRDLGKTFIRERDEGEATEALRAVTLDVEAGEFVCLLGPSGCGKSTLLQIMAGLEFHTTGQITFGGEPIRGPGTERGYIFQRFNLFPWLTALENVKFGLRFKAMAEADRDRIALQNLQLVGLGRFQNHYPRELSGGMQQRVSLARTLAVAPEVYLMDEPFGSLDAQTRQVMQRELIALWQRTELHHKTIVFVTHDITEAVLLGDRIVVLTARPGTVKTVILVALPRPRDPLDPAFAALARRVRDQLEAEIDKSIQEELTAGAARHGVPGGPRPPSSEGG